MFELRRSGWSFGAIADHFHKDHSTVVYHCHKHNVYPEKGSTLTISRKYFKTKKILEQLQQQQEEEQNATDAALTMILKEEGSINTGKTYAQYIADHTARKATLPRPPLRPWIAKYFSEDTVKETKPIFSVRFDQPTTNELHTPHPHKRTSTVRPTTKKTRAESNTKSNRVVQKKHSVQRRPRNKGNVKK